MSAGVSDSGSGGTIGVVWGYRGAGTGLNSIHGKVGARLVGCAGLALSPGLCAAWLRLAEGIRTPVSSTLHSVDPSARLRMQLIRLGFLVPGRPDLELGSQRRTMT